MERRSNLSDVTREPKKPVERRPLIDHRRLRSCRGLSRSASVVDSGLIYKASSSNNKPKSVDAMPELGHQQLRPLHAQQHALNRSQSAPYHFRCPQYRVNPVVKFDDRAIPESMNYGIAGYNTSRRRSFSSIPDTAISRPQSFTTNHESARAERPRSFTTNHESARAERPRSFTTIDESSKAERPRNFTTIQEPARAERPRSFSTIQESRRERPRSFSTIHESRRERPRSFSSVLGSTTKPRSILSRSVRSPRPAPRAVNWKSLTQQFRDKVGKIRVRDSCSKFLSRFLG